MPYPCNSAQRKVLRRIYSMAAYFVLFGWHGPLHNSFPFAGSHGKRRNVQLLHTLLYRPFRKVAGQVNSNFLERSVYLTLWFLCFYWHLSCEKILTWCSVISKVYVMVVLGTRSWLICGACNYAFSTIFLQDRDIQSSTFSVLGQFFFDSHLGMYDGIECTSFLCSPHYLEKSININDTNALYMAQYVVVWFILRRTSSKLC
jgi:hypothetical protein